MAEKFSIAVACADENWISGVEAKFMDEFKDEELSFITDSDYLNEYFSQPRNINVLLIDGELYGEEFLRHNIAKTFVLSEEPKTQSLGDSPVKYVSKYDTLKSVVQQIKAAEKEIKGDGAKPTLAYFYSPSEGAGANACAIGAAIELSQNQGKSVLYINTGSLQSFGYAAGVESSLDSYAEDALKAGGEECYKSVKPYEEKSDYCDNLFVIPPFGGTLPSLKLSEASYKTLAGQAAAAGDYDYIIVSGDSAYTDDKSSFMGIADKIVLISKQDANSAFEFNKFLKLIDYKSDKFVFVINEYEKDKEDALKKESPSNSLKYVKVNKAAGERCLPYLNDSAVYADLAYEFG